MALVVNEIPGLFLVTQRKPLETVEPNPFLRWLLRRYFSWRGFACRSHTGDCTGKCYASIEYRGVFSDEAQARWAASCPGGAYRKVPFNGALPEETVSYGNSDVPFSEASAEYRKGVSLPFTAIPTHQLEHLQQRLASTE